MQNEWQEDITEYKVLYYKELDNGVARVYMYRDSDGTWPTFFTAEIALTFDRNYWSQAVTVQQAQNWVFNTLQDLEIK